jgi:predicted phosphodiesterase
MRLAIITDGHANLPALDAALDAIAGDGYDLLVHTGDAIGIGPFPAECLDRLLEMPRTRYVIGNHDAWFAHGLPTPQPSWMSDGEVAHQHWTHAQLDPTLRTVVAGWPYHIGETLEGVKVSFLHYGLDASGQNFRPIIAQTSIEELDQLFADTSGALIFYGHHHPQADAQGRARYTNPGSLGCNQHALARYCLADISQGRWTISQRAIPYDDRALYAAFEQRAVPERAFLYRAFFGGRFGT